jgi:broad specificity phosphatase PhoE
MKLIIARHGQSEYNVLGLCNSDPTVRVPLTALGAEQAGRLAEELRGRPFEMIFVSELERVQKTAEVVNRFHDVPVTVDARLGDIRTGFESRSATEYQAALAAAADPWNARLGNGGESLRDVAARVGLFLEDLKARDLKEALIITSLCPLQALRGLIENLDDPDIWDYEVGNSGYLTYDI